MQEVKIRALAILNLWPELWRREWHFISMKMAEARASGGALELVSAIFGPNSIRPNYFRHF